jgi:hypothetical protein
VLYATSLQVLLQYCKAHAVSVLSEIKLLPEDNVLRRKLTCTMDSLNDNVIIIFFSTRILQSDAMRREE